MLDRLDVSRIVLAIRPGHHHLCAQDGPLGQSLAGRHGGVLPLANCHEDFMDVRFLLSLSLSLFLYSSPGQSPSFRPPSSRGVGTMRMIHTLSLSHTHAAQCQCLRQRYVTERAEVQGTASTNRTKKCAANLSGRNGTAKAAAERAQCFTAPTAAAAARAALFLSLETPIRHFMRDLEPRGVALDVPGPPPRPRVRLR